MRVSCRDRLETELDEHDPAHRDAYTTTTAQLVVDGRQTAAFTMKTRRPGKTVGKAAEVRQAANDRV